MEAPKKILIVEDEMIIGAKVSMYLTEMGYEVTGIITRAEEVLLHLEVATPDLILLDIQLKGEMDGIDLAQHILETSRVPVVFLTANSDEKSFARAKPTHPYGFLSKPVKRIELKRTLELSFNLLKNQNASTPSPATKPTESTAILSDRIFIYHQEKRIKLLFQDILFVQAERNYCKIITALKTYILTMPMKSLEQELPSSIFHRIHRSYIVNLRHVSEVDDRMVKVGDHRLVLSKSHRVAFLGRIRSV